MPSRSGRAAIAEATTGTDERGRMSADGLDEVVRGLGVRIEITELPGDRDGEYRHAERLIRLQRGMSRRLHRSVLAHECGHAVHGDEPTSDSLMSARQERRADEWAARFLIGIDDYAAAEMLHAGHLEAMAVELDVTLDLAIAFHDLLERGAAAAPPVTSTARTVGAVAKARPRSRHPRGLQPLP